MEHQFKVWETSRIFFETKVDYNHGFIGSQSWQSKLIRMRWVLGLIFQNETGFPIPFVCGTGTEIILIYFLKNQNINL
jgi:hypothetical protein